MWDWIKDAHHRTLELGDVDYEYWFMIVRTATYCIVFMIFVRYDTIQHNTTHHSSINVQLILNNSEDLQLLEY